MTRASQRKTVTMRDVARRANVSQSTVSRVLSGSSSPVPIGEETRQRVLEAVRELGYQPNLHAGSLRGKKTQMLAMMIADIGNPFYHPMVRAVQDVARSHRYDVMVANTDHLAAEERFFCDSILRRPVDGILLVPYHLSRAEIDRLLTRTGAPVVALGQHVDHPEVDVVFGNDELAIQQAISWLIEEKGHTRIGFIGPSPDSPVGNRRRLAFLDTLERAGLQAPPSAYFQTGDWSPESGLEAMAALLSLPTPPTAVFACNDLMAIGAIQQAKQQGRRVPEDIAVVGFDDIPAASWIDPRLTTIAQYPAQIGKTMAEAVFERIEGNYEGPGRRFEVLCRFIPRESA